MLYLFIRKIELPHYYASLKQQYTSICWYLRVLPVLRRPEVVDIGVNTIKKNMSYALRTRLQSFLSIQYVHGDLCKHLGIDSSTDHPDRYSNLFLNAYINRHVHAEYLKMI